jgi:hypothetical protein
MASRRALLTVITLTLFFFASSSAREPTCHPWVKDCAAIMESSAGPAYDSNPAAVLASHNRTPRGELAQGLCYAELPDCGSSSDEGYGGSEYCASTDSEYLPVQNSTHVVGANSNNMRLAAEAMCRLSRCNPETGLWQVWQGAATCTRPALTQNQSFSSLSPPLAQVFQELSPAAGDEGASSFELPKCGRVVIDRALVIGCPSEELVAIFGNQS